MQYINKLMHMIRYMLLKSYPFQIGTFGTEVTTSPKLGIRRCGGGAGLAAPDLKRGIAPCQISNDDPLRLLLA